MMISQYEIQVSRLQILHAAAQKAVATEKQEIAKAEKCLEVELEAQQLAQQVAQAVQEKVHQSIAAVVTRCLKAVFGENAYEFIIYFDRKRGKTEARLMFRRDDLEIHPLLASGGGPVDVAAFALRLAALTLTKPKRRKILFLDEAFRNVSKDYWPALQEMLVGISQDLGIQLVLVTHEEGLKVGKVIEIGGA